jgi:DNA repair exonuclease SbcCD ATPase subunit
MKLTLLNTRKGALEAEFEDEKNKISDYTTRENEIRVEIRTLESNLQTYKNKKFEYETFLSSYKEKQLLVEKIEGEYQVKVASKSQLEKEVKELKDGITKTVTLKDYLSYIKETLKDDNTKQYAISSIIPYLNQRTNYYLSETGHNYYIKLDNWMDGEICGSGVGEADFGNMSGGEGKSIDLALKFAMMDVARRQAGSYLDIMVLDELLDSSIDSFGLESLMNIVKVKQQEDNMKVYIVSHREEISDYGFDNIYKVSKRNGFSTIGET